MKQTPQPGISQQRPPCRLSRGTALLLLCIFLCVRGLVPAGFMPGSVAAGTPYDLCHGDSRSALLLQSLSPTEHAHHHRHDGATAQAFADNHCSFSASAGMAASPAPEAPVLAAASGPTPDTGFRPPLSLRSYLLPRKRAPPLSRSA